MTTFVLDCSVMMAWVFPDEASEATDRLRESMIRGGAFVPALWPVEVGNVLLHRNPSWANRRGRMVPDLRESRSVAHRSRSRFHVPRMGRRACARTRASALRLRCGVPRIGGANAATLGHAGSGARRRRTGRRAGRTGERLTSGGGGGRMPCATGRSVHRSVQVHRFDAKRGRPQQPRAMPFPVPMALTGGAIGGGQGHRQAD